MTRSMRGLTAIASAALVATALLGPAAVRAAKPTPASSAPDATPTINPGQDKKTTPTPAPTTIPVPTATPTPAPAATPAVSAPSPTLAPTPTAPTPAATPAAIGGAPSAGVSPGGARPAATADLPGAATTVPDATPAAGVATPDAAAVGLTDGSGPATGGSAGDSPALAALVGVAGAGTLIIAGWWYVAGRRRTDDEVEAAVARRAADGGGAPRPDDDGPGDDGPRGGRAVPAPAGQMASRPVGRAHDPLVAAVARSREARGLSPNPRARDPRGSVNAPRTPASDAPDAQAQAFDGPTWVRRLDTSIRVIPTLPPGSEAAGRAGAEGEAGPGERRSA